MGSTAGCAVRDHPLYSSLHRSAARRSRERAVTEDRADDRRRADARVQRQHARRRGPAPRRSRAAVWLGDFGQHDIAIVTESWGGGTSANAGSDKQTYYKLSPSTAGCRTRPRLLAEDLFAGGSMHGDIALCEAQHSAQAFYRLVQLGVPFPARPLRRVRRATAPTTTSAAGRRRPGPLTSQQMVDALASEVVAPAGSVSSNRWQVVSLLTATRGPDAQSSGRWRSISRDAPAASARFALFNAVNVVLGTGGPGGMYADSVYPDEQTGSIGLALRAGAIAQNLTESQFGLASTAVPLERVGLVSAGGAAVRVDRRRRRRRSASS